MPPRPNYLADHGLTLIEHGYPVIPIRPGSKAPISDRWQTIEATPELHNQWLADNYGSFGLGILTEHFPAIDIDTLHPGLAKEFLNWCDDQLGYAPIRIGRAPKALMLFRTDQPFYKKFSSEWVDEPQRTDIDGRPVVHRLEVLGKGQQFVAYAIHKDTKRPYTWTSAETPLNLFAADLPTLTQGEADKACVAFDELAEKHGLRRLGRTRSRTAPLANGHDWTADVATKMGFTADKIRETLAHIPNEDDESVSYDDWLQVGMGIFHETDGSDEGFDMWEYWSERSHKHNHSEAEKKWKSFAIEGKGRAPTTFRTAVKFAEPSRLAQKDAVSNRIKAALAAATTKAAFTTAIRDLQTAEMETLERDSFVPAVMTAYERAYGAKMLVTRARQTVRAAPQSTSARPDWVRPYVLDTQKNEMFNTDTKQSFNHLAFNHRFDREMLSQAERAAGKMLPDVHAVDFALHYQQVAHVAGVRYCPWEEPLFNRDGFLWANSYSNALVPAAPAQITPWHRRAVKVFTEHLEHLIIDERERELFLDWLCHPVRTGHRCNWCVVILGCEGDGKTWLVDLMALVLGAGNVNIASAASIKDRFNPWAENAQIVAVEEIRFTGHNRYDIMNQLKPLITNSIIEIHRKNQHQYNTVNTAQYLMFTNHGDAIPVDDATSRYFILRTRWQQRRDLLTFQKDHPDYYARLAGVLEDAEGIAAIRAHMIQRTPHPEFSAVTRAPDSEGKDYMASVVRTERESQLIDEIDRGLNPLLCRELICVAEAQSFLQEATGEFGRAEEIGRFLRRAEFQLIGQVRIGKERHTFWSGTPQKFQVRRKTIPRLVVAYINAKDGREV